MKSGHKVSIGSCDPGMVSGSFAFALMQLSAVRSSRLGSHIRIKGSGLLSKQRNRVVKHFLDTTDSDWLLMIDSDEQLSVENFDKLIDAAHHIERPIVAGLVFAAFDVGWIYPQPLPAIFMEQENGFLPLYNYDKNSIFEIDAAGTGCLLVHRSVLEKMREHTTEHQGQDWCWFWDGAINGEWVGEDLLFCRRAKQLGFPIYAHTGVILPHLKTYWVQEAHHEFWQHNVAPALKGKNEKTFDVRPDA